MTHLGFLPFSYLHGLRPFADPPGLPLFGVPLPSTAAPQSCPHTSTTSKGRERCQHHLRWFAGCPPHPSTGVRQPSTAVRDRPPALLILILILILLACLNLIHRGHMDRPPPVSTPPAGGVVGFVASWVCFLLNPEVVRAFVALCCLCCRVLVLDPVSCILLQAGPLVPARRVLA